MKAHILYDINKMKLSECDIPSIQEGWVLVQMKAAGICGSDVPRTFTTGAHRHPIIIGHEFSGQVLTENQCQELNCITNSSQEKWSGKRVGIFPLIPCMECEPCKKKQYEMCRHYNYLGSRCNGGFAEYVAVPEWNLIELPDTVSFEAAAMLEPAAVALHAIRNIKPSKEDTVVVCGLGTIGLLVVMLLKEMGVRNILALGNKNFQKECFERIVGEEGHYIDVKETNPLSAISDYTSGNGVDIFMECVGKVETYNLAVSATMPGGRIQLVGNPYSDMELDKATYWKILRNQLTLKGTWNSSFTHNATDDWNQIVNLLNEKRIDPEILITHKLPFEELMYGLEIMKNKSEDFVKIMIEN